jgi:hypothetical protein
VTVREPGAKNLTHLFSSINPSLGVTVASLYFPFRTVFAHYHFSLRKYASHPEFFNPEKHFNRCNGLNLKFASILYSELPNYYSLKLGVTSSLSEGRLSGVQRDILRTYDFPLESFLPSMFPKRELEITGAQVFFGQKEGHMRSSERSDA